MKLSILLTHPNAKASSAVKSQKASSVSQTWWKPSLFVALVGLTLPSVQAQNSAVNSSTFGCEQVTVAAATSGSMPASTVISIPFYNAAVFVGAISSVDGANALSTSTANFTANQYATTAAPYLLHLKSGTSIGRYFLITANTSSQFTVAPRGYDLTTIISPGDIYEVIPANTLTTLFGSGATSFAFQTGASASQADNILLWNSTQWTVYYNNGTNWKRSGSLTNQNDTIVYPDEGLYITRRATSALLLTFVGNVPTTTERSDLPGPGFSFVANRFPADTTLGTFGFQNLPNWQSGSSASQADNVYLWTGTTWGVYYYNGTNWKKSGSLLNTNTQSIPSGTAAYIVRQSVGSGTVGTLTQTPPYTTD